MIADIVLQVLKTSVFTSLLAGLLLLLTPLLQKRYRAKWRYMAWIVIAVRLLIPVNLSLPQAPIRIELPEQATTIASPPIANAARQPESPLRPDVGEDAIPEVTPIFSAPSAVAFSPLQVVGLVWLAGMVLFLAVQICSYQIFIHKLKSSQAETIPTSFKETIWQIGVDMGVCKLPEPMVTDRIDAPVLIGVLHPRVLLPHTNYTEEELSFILRHELVHYRRRDMWYKLVLLLANALHWFNPLIYLMTVQAAKDIELACDDDVIRELDREARAKYGNTILAALPGKKRLEPVFSTHFGSTKKNMKSRLRNLFDTAVKRRGIAALCTVVVCAATVTGTVTFAQAAKPDSITKITEAHSFSIPSIAPGEVVCIGEIQLGQDISYFGAFSVESGSKPMIALYDQPNVTHSAGIGWNQSFGGTDSKIWFSSNTPQTAYVYVGSRGTTRLIGVSGNLQRQKGEADQISEKLPAGGRISAKAVDGTWGSATEVGGDSDQARRDEMIRWLEQIDAKHQSPFVIYETIPEEEVTNPAQIQYLYQNSQVYRTMSAMKAGAFPVWDSESFSRSFMKGEKVLDRTAVMVDTDAEVEMDIRYALDEGRMTVWLVNPAGKVVYWGDQAKQFNQTFSVQGVKGLWSVITISEPANGAVSGSCHMTLRTRVATGQAAASDTIISADQQDKNAVFWLSNGGGKSIVQSSSFEAKAGETLTVTAVSNIQGGTVDLFLISPTFAEKRITFGGSNTTETIELSAGRWAYNCTGFFDSGKISITGTIANPASVGRSKASTAADKEGINIMENSGTWGESINRLLPNMSPAAVEKVVDIYLDRHLLPNITPPQAAKQMASTIDPALQYMTKEARESANSRIVAYY